MSGAPVFIIGPFPPPVHGAAVITAAIADRLAPFADVRRCDISPGVLARGAAYHLRRIGRVFAAAAAVAQNVGRQGCVYISAAGGSGLLYNLLIAAVARLLRQRVVLHHHSFAYLDRPSNIMALLVRVAGASALHVALCPRMAGLLRERYGVRDSHCVSNAAFYPPRDLAAFAAGGALRLGHMGNLTDEKGLDLALALYREAAAAGIAARLVLAGPAADAAAERDIAAARDACGDGLDYRGPVYGADKDRFFADIDVFLFPTRYFNEAEPTVLFEALARGVPVIALARGCIAEQIGAEDGEGEAGAVLASPESFVPRAQGILRGWVDAPERFAVLRANSRARLSRLHDEAVADLERLLRGLAPGAAS